MDSSGQEQGRHGEGRKTAGVEAAGGGGSRMWGTWGAGDIPVEIPNGSLQAKQHGRSLKPRKLPSSSADGCGCPHLIMSCPECWTTSVRNAWEVQWAQVGMQVWLSFT